jgi:hypothetical protein
MTMKRYRNHREGGYVALLSTIIVAAVLMVAAIQSAIAGYHARFNILGTEAKEQATALAQGCADQALSAILTDPSYTGSSVTVSEDGTCEVLPIEFNTPAAGIVTIRAQAEVRGAFSNLEMQMDMHDIHIDTLPEAPTKGTLVVITNVVNDGSGTSDPNDFIMQVSGTNPSDTTFPGSESGVPITLDAGSYSVTETAHAGYRTSISTNCSGTIAAGELKFCTITNDDITTTLTVIVNVVNDDGGTMTVPEFFPKLNGTAVASGNRNTVTPGTHTVSVTVPSGYVASDWGYQCTGLGTATLAEGDNLTCIINIDDVEPPTPECSDTVLMLDRTGSMSSTDLANERAAANGLLDLYAPLSPRPQVGVGVFGAVGANEPYPAALVQGLTIGNATPYDTVRSAIATFLASAGGYTNLQSAISVADAELNGVRHLPNKEKVMILLSDGGTNRPSGATVLDTGFRAPSSHESNAGTSWVTPEGAYGLGEATDMTGVRQRYGGFGLNIPNGAVINGIETRITGYSSVAATTLFTDAFGSGTTDAAVPGWTENPTGTGGPERRTSTASGNDTISPDGGRFAYLPGAGSTICRQVNATGLTGLRLTYYWRGDINAEGSDTGVVEFNANGTCSSSNGWSQSASHALNTSTGSWSSLQNIALPSSLNNDASFAIRFRANSSAVDEGLRIDAPTLTGTTACTIGADLSWNGGANWTSEKTVALGATTNTYTLGNANDRWGRTTWTPAELSDGTFRARIRSVNAGPLCTVDALEVRAHYALSTTPQSAAYAAADAAKQNGTTIFTIHFGDAGAGNADQDFLARLATGNTPNAPYENGSFNDPGGTVTSDTGLVSPTADMVTTGGDGNGFEEGPDDAYTDQNAVAQNYDGAGDRHIYYGYNFNVPPNATITGIRVRPDWWVEETAGTNSVSIELSWDGGTTWTTAQTQSTESTSDTNGKFVGGSSNTWGRTWTDANLAPDKFRLRITTNSTVATRDFWLDWVPVQVYYTVIGENADGDNFFISPTSADMPGIFKYIGEQVCPAVGFAAVSEPPTNATVKVITQVLNNNGGTLTPQQVRMHAQTGGPSPNAWDGTASGKDVTFASPGTYRIYGDVPTGYVEIPSASCSSNSSTQLVPGESRVCVLTYEDVPPPPPPPNLTINLGSWIEVPVVQP